MRFSEKNSGVRALGSQLPLRSSEHKLNYQEFYSLKNTLYCIMSFSNRVKLAYIKFLGTQGKKFDIGWDLIYSRNITCACNRPGFPIWLLYREIQYRWVQYWWGVGDHWICICVFQDIYGMFPQGKNQIVSWVQEKS